MWGARAAARAAGAAMAATALTLALSGCADLADANPDAAAAGQSDASGPEGVLDFTAATISGAPLEAADLAGQPLVLWFWAPWCVICRAEGPEVAEVAADLDGRVEFLGVAARSPLGDMRAFVDKTGTGGFEHVADVDGAVWRRFEVVAQPTFVFVAPSGSTTTFAGSLGADELRARALDMEEG